MLEAIPFLFIAIVGFCAILFRRRITQSVVRWQQKVLDVTTGQRGIKILEWGYIVIGVFFLVMGLLSLLRTLK
jgi:hypothetical protein